MQYSVIRNKKYDFTGQGYSSSSPNLHRYPATMIPQVGIEILKEMGIHRGKLLDPYCGSGSSFMSGLACGITEMEGFDINPLAVLISRAKFTKVDIERVKLFSQRLRNAVYEFIKLESNYDKLSLPTIYNIGFWFSEYVSRNLSVLKYFIDKIKNKDVRRIFLVPFSETARECSNTRNDEFKLFRMKSEDLLKFNPDVFGVFFAKLRKVIEIYKEHYYPMLDKSSINIDFKKFPKRNRYFNVVLTSPPYGDSRTTVAYGQFSTFANEWLGFKNARQMDNLLMGGKLAKNLYTKGLLKDYIFEISKVSEKRALEVSAFYNDLDKSIIDVAFSVKKGGNAIYVVGNRTVKNVELPTDQFIAESFESKGFKHILTYKRLLSNKVMPSRNSPSNKAGILKNTMKFEYIVVCEKVN